MLNSQQIPEETPGADPRLLGSQLEDQATGSVTHEDGAEDTADEADGEPLKPGAEAEGRGIQGLQGQLSLSQAQGGAMAHVTCGLIGGENKVARAEALELGSRRENQGHLPAIT